MYRCRAPDDPCFVNQGRQCKVDGQLHLGEGPQYNVDIISTTKDFLSSGYKTA